jgi:hypothetical protein
MEEAVKPRKRDTKQDRLFERTEEEEEGQRRVERATVPIPERKVPPSGGEQSSRESQPWWSR